VNVLGDKNSISSSTWKQVLGRKETTLHILIVVTNFGIPYKYTKYKKIQKNKKNT
jgi:hypothetical protein